MRISSILTILLVCAPLGAHAWFGFGLRGSDSEEEKEIEEIEEDVEAAEADELKAETMLTELEADKAEEIAAEDEDDEEEGGKKTTSDEELNEMIDETRKKGEVEMAPKGKALALGHHHGKATGQSKPKTKVEDEDAEEMIDETMENSEVETSSSGGKKLGHAKYSYDEAKSSVRKKEVKDKEEELQSVLDELEKTNAAIDKIEAAMGGPGGRSTSQGNKGGYSYEKPNVSSKRKHSSGQGEKGKKKGP